MSQVAGGIMAIGDDEDDNEPGQRRKQPASATNPPSLESGPSSLAVLLRDEPNWLSHIRALQETDVIILLTPVVAPVGQVSNNSSDPFEPFGRSLARRHQRVRHVPYTQRNGITSTHLGFIKRGHVVILCFAIPPSQYIQSQIADVVFAVNDDKPCIIVVCCSTITAEQDVSFPTLIQCSGYTPLALEATVQVMFGEPSEVYSQTLNESVILDSLVPRVWVVEQWDQKNDLASVYSIWVECMDERFVLEKGEFASLLHRPGYGRHYVVKDPDQGHVLGFCATYLSYVDQEGENLVASIAILLVPASSRRRGIGSSLHNHAIAQLKRTRGVIRLQLGSTYPRILHGPSYDVHTNEDWFLRRGWQLDEAPLRDFMLEINDWQPLKSSVTHFTFRKCTQADMVEVLDLVERAAAGRLRTGWFDQYSALIDDPNVKDAILGLAEDTIIATALTYTPACGSQISSNLPWAGHIGNDVGGITCMCVKPNLEGSITTGMLDACIQNLKAQGMKKVFMDGITEGADGLAALGFVEWAKYRDVWRDV